MNLDYLLQQPPIRARLLRYFTAADLIVLRYVTVWVERPNVQPMAAIAVEGDLYLINWAEQQWKLAGPPPSKDGERADAYRHAHKHAFMAATIHGRLEAVQWAIETGRFYPSLDVLCAAAEHGHLHLMEYFYYTDVLKCKARAKCGGKGKRGDPVAASVTLSNNVKLLDWMSERGFVFGSDTITRAARRGNVETLEWLLLHGVAPNDNVQHAAFENEDSESFIATIHVLHKYGLITKDSYNYAAVCDGIDTMRWLDSISIRPEPECIRSAVKYGRRETIEHLLSVGCAWSPNVCADALVLDGGALDMISWLLSKGAPWTPRVCYVAATKGLDDVIRFADSRLLPYEYLACEQIKAQRKRNLARRDKLMNVARIW
jgi:hypothetical protein